MEVVDHTVGFLVHMEDSPEGFLAEDLQENLHTEDAPHREGPQEVPHH